MQKDLDRILLSRHAISERVAALAADIAADFESQEEDAELVVIPVLTGALIFVADLMRNLPHRLRIDFMDASSYPGKATRSLGEVSISAAPRHLEGRDVLIIDDILDSGRTLTAIRGAIAEHNPRSIRSCVLLRKSTAAALDVACEYVGFDTVSYTHLTLPTTPYV